jgi:hypothetical protein
MRSKEIWQPGSRSVLVGTVVSIGQTLRARSELRRALAAEAYAQAVLQFLQEDVLSQASPGPSAGS